MPDPTEEDPSHALVCPPPGIGRGPRGRDAKPMSRSAMLIPPMARERFRKGPRCGPFTGDRFTHQRPAESGSTVEARWIFSGPRAVSETCSW